jgi:hypothetical protein
MAKLTAIGLLVAGPVEPVGPELPDTAIGLLADVDDAFPVSPVFVALACELAAPDPPDEAVGLAETEAVPPTPPLALPTEMLDPPTAD